MCNKKFNSTKIDFISVFSLLLIFFIAMSTTPQLKAQTKKQTLKHPAWSFNQTIYEVNLRQYTKAGTFKAFEKHLPAIKKLGVGIIWLMPINPIGVKNRKGKLGSYYSVKNYLKVNPNYGTLKDLKALVTKIHKLGMYVIIDWVADHTSWDNNLTIEHPEWYKKDAKGNFVPPVKDWTDVIALNYKKKGLRKYMINALEYWVKKTNIDGYRCDVADMVPTSFWNEARAALDKIKPVFMLAEAEKPYLQEKAFDMTYSWKFYTLMNNIAKGKKNASDINKYFAWEDSTYSRNDFRMRFTTNHDENSWNGTVFERLGEGAAAFGALTVAVPGMPLLYGGQEAGMNKRLKFFSKDPIVWKKSKFRELYTKLFNLKMTNPALRNGKEGGRMILISKPDDKSVYSFIREKGNSKVFVIFNLTDKPVSTTLKNKKISGDYTDLFTGKEVQFSNSKNFNLKPWDYKFFIK